MPISGCARPKALTAGRRPKAAPGGLNQSLRLHRGSQPPADARNGAEGGDKGAAKRCGETRSLAQISGVARVVIVAVRG